ncbi:MAG: hypothetical protein ACKOWF_16890, partial [Chloroflexota bacterium]
PGAAAAGRPQAAPEPRAGCVGDAPAGKPCQRNTDCCSNICDRKGSRRVCRCRTADQPCARDANCCGALVCLQGACASAAKPERQRVATGAACTPDSVCLARRASCTRYERATPPGRFCLLPPGDACARDADCVTSRCRGGVCVANTDPVASGQRCGPTDACADPAASCSAYLSGDPAGTFCLLPESAVCNEDAACASGRCRNGACQRPAVATGQPCEADDVCAAAAAGCMAYRFDDPPGTRCLLTRGAACGSDADCRDRRCVKGVCQACSAAACVETCQPFVCAGTGCLQAAIDAAPAGATLAIPAGPYQESLVVGKSLTLRACPGDRVVLVNAADNERTVSTLDGVSLDLLDIIVEGAQRSDGLEGGGIHARGNLGLYGRSAVRNAVATLGGGIVVEGAADATLANPGVLTITDHVVIRGNGAKAGGGGLAAMPGTAVILDEAAAIRDNEHFATVAIPGAYSGGGGIFADEAPITIMGDASISGNRTVELGGGVHYRAANLAGPALVVTGRAVVSGNRARIGGGISGRALATGDGGTVIESGGAVTGNFARTTAGGLYLFGAPLELHDHGAVSENSAYAGGGVIVDGPFPPSVTGLLMTGDSLISGNDGLTLGGGALSTGAARLQDRAAIRENTATTGAGLALGSPVGLTISGDAAITANTASVRAGGLWSLTDCLVLAPVPGVSANTPDNICRGDEQNAVCS